MKVSRSPGIGAMTVIAALLFVSAALRLLGVSNVAFALDGQGESQNNASIAVDWPEQDGNLGVLLSSFQSREQRIKAEEQRISKRLEQLIQAEASIASQLAKLEEAELQLRKLLSIADSASEDDVARLTSVYENMKPKAAAIVFEEMAPEFAAGFLARMRPDAAALVMAGLNPQTAYAVSVVLAGRHIDVEKNKRD